MWHADTPQTYFLIVYYIIFDSTKAIVTAIEILMIYMKKWTAFVIPK
jgi:hypothetical protein